jgi:hypothetical protein
VKIGRDLTSLAAAACLLVAGCGDDDDKGSESKASPEDQIRSVLSTAADAFASQDAATFCKISDTSDLAEHVRESNRQDLKELLDTEGPAAVCEQLADEVLFDDVSAEEKADAESLKVVSVKITGNEATAEVRTRNDETDATFRRVGGEWKFVQSTALE